jgi:hypothetical protein
MKSSGQISRFPVLVVDDDKTTHLVVGEATERKKKYCAAKLGM